jgi:hypothetical protein
VPTQVPLKSERPDHVTILLEYLQAWNENLHNRALFAHEPLIAIHEVEAGEQPDVRPSGDTNIQAGDIVVTATTGGHYFMGRVNADRTQAQIGIATGRDAALQRACTLSGDAQRVYLYPSAGTNALVSIDCSKIRH